ncbi:MAG TPA: MerR family transcriptional regulator [Candidatus Acidoferrales bacterium]|jgi:DNA-binding transcriptional MerR regulator|nr:MerR family transcriptional regulator [Candidatus Acidoferrales bacterium]
MSDTGNGHAAHLLPDKSFFRIGEVSRLTATKTFVLRYWETEFPMLQPVKSPSGHRLYRREDVQTVMEIRRLLYDEGFTIAGARRHLREHAGHDAAHNGGNSAHAEGSNGADHSAEPTGSSSGTTSAAGISADDPLPAVSRKVLLDLRDALRAFLTLLETE